MSRLVTIFALLTVLRASTPLEMPCPPPEDIYPCSCQTVTPKSAENWVTCERIKSLNQLTSLVSALRGYEIRKFRLISADIGYIPNNLFFLTHIFEIDFTETTIDNFTRSDGVPFTGLENRLEVLTFSRCKLGTGISWESLYGMNQLVYLDSSFTSYPAVDRNWFRFSHPTLVSLVLKGGKIEAVADDAFAKLFSLKHLDLSENKLKVLKRSMFANVSSLVFLSINNNRLSSLPEDVFHQMPFLRRVRIMFNSISTLDVSVWRPIFGQLQTLDMEDNPIVCDLEVCWITQYLPPSYFYGKCAGPPSVAGRTLLSLNFWDVANCTSPNQVIENSVE